MANRMVFLAVVLGCLAAAPARPAAQAQQPPPHRGKWWQEEDVQRQLGLTMPQVDSIEKVWRQDLNHRIELRRTLDALQARWNTALEQGEIGDVDAERLIDQVEQARMERNKARTFVLLQMYRVLTPDQRSRLGKVLAAPAPAP